MAAIDNRILINDIAGAPRGGGQRDANPNRRGPRETVHVVNQIVVNDVINGVRMQKNPALRPGIVRVVAMDDAVPHRIVLPTQGAGGIIFANLHSRIFNIVRFNILKDGPCAA